MEGRAASSASSKQRRHPREQSPRLPPYSFKHGRLSGTGTTTTAKGKPVSNTTSHFFVNDNFELRRLFHQEHANVDKAKINKNRETVSKPPEVEILSRLTKFNTVKRTVSKPPEKNTFLTPLGQINANMAAIPIETVAKLIQKGAKYKEHPVVLKISSPSIPRAISNFDVNVQTGAKCSTFDDFEAMIPQSRMIVTQASPGTIKKAIDQATLLPQSPIKAAKSESDETVTILQAKSSKTTKNRLIKSLQAKMTANTSIQQRKTLHRKMKRSNRLHLKKQFRKWEGSSEDDDDLSPTYSPGKAMAVRILKDHDSLVTTAKTRITSRNALKTKPVTNKSGLLTTKPSTSHSKPKESVKVLQEYIFHKTQTEMNVSPTPKVQTVPSPTKVRDTQSCSKVRPMRSLKIGPSQSPIKGHLSQTLVKVGALQAPINVQHVKPPSKGQPAFSPNKVVDGHISDDSVNSQTSFMSDVNGDEEMQTYRQVHDCMDVSGSMSSNEENSRETLILQLMSNSDGDTCDPGEIICAYDHDGNLVCMQKGEGDELIMLPIEEIEDDELSTCTDENVSELNENNNSFDLGIKQMNDNDTNIDENVSQSVTETSLAVSEVSMTVSDAFEAPEADVGNEEIIAETVPKPEAEECAIPTLTDATIEEPVFILHAPEAGEAATPLEVAFMQAMQKQLAFSPEEVTAGPNDLIPDELIPDELIPDELLTDDLPTSLLGLQSIAADLETLLQAQDQCRIVEYHSSESDDELRKAKENVPVDEMSHEDIAKMILGEGLDARPVDEDKSLDLLQLPPNYEPKPIILTQPILPLTFLHVDDLPNEVPIEEPHDIDQEVVVQDNESKIFKNKLNGKLKKPMKKSNKKKKRSVKGKNKCQRVRPRPEVKHVFHVTGDSHLTNEESPDISTETEQADKVESPMKGVEQTLSVNTIVSIQPTTTLNEKSPSEIETSPLEQKLSQLLTPPTSSPNDKFRVALPKKLQMSPLERKISKEYNLKKDLIVNLNAKETDRLSLKYLNKSASDASGTSESLSSNTSNAESLSSNTSNETDLGNKKKTARVKRRIGGRKNKRRKYHKMIETTIKEKQPSVETTSVVTIDDVKSTQECVECFDAVTASSPSQILSMEGNRTQMKEDEAASISNKESTPDVVSELLNKNNSQTDNVNVQLKDVELSQDDADYYSIDLDTSIKLLRDNEDTKHDNVIVVAEEETGDLKTKTEDQSEYPECNKIADVSENCEKDNTKTDNVANQSENTEPDKADVAWNIQQRLDCEYEKDDYKTENVEDNSEYSVIGEITVVSENIEYTVKGDTKDDIKIDRMEDQLEYSESDIVSENIQQVIEVMTAVSDSDNEDGQSKYPKMNITENMAAVGETDNEDGHLKYPKMDITENMASEGERDNKQSQSKYPKTDITENMADVGERDNENGQSKYPKTDITENMAAVGQRDNEDGQPKYLETDVTENYQKPKDGESVKVEMKTDNVEDESEDGIDKITDFSEKIRQCVESETKDDIKTVKMEDQTEYSEIDKAENVSEIIQETVSCDTSTSTPETVDVKPNDDVSTDADVVAIDASPDGNPEKVTSDVKSKRKSSKRKSLLAQLIGNDFDFWELEKTRSSTAKKVAQVISPFTSNINVPDVTSNNEVSIAVDEALQVTPKGKEDDKASAVNIDDKDKNNQVRDEKEVETKNENEITPNQEHITKSGNNIDDQNKNNQGTDEKEVETKNEKEISPNQEQTTKSGKSPLGIKKARSSGDINISKEGSKIERAGTTPPKSRSLQNSRRSSPKNKKKNRAEIEKFHFKINIKNLVSKAKSAFAGFVDKTREDVSNVKANKLSSPKNKSKKRKSISPLTSSTSAENLISDLKQSTKKPKVLFSLKSPNKTTTETSQSIARGNADDVVFVSDNTIHSPIVITDDPELVINIKPNIVQANKVNEEKIILHVHDEDVFNVGDLVYGRLGTYCFWPCMITKEPFTEVHTKQIGKIQSYHVRFFGDNGRRAWIIKQCIKHYKGPDTIQNLHEVLLQWKRNGTKFDTQMTKELVACKISRKLSDAWQKGVGEAESLIDKSVEERHEFFFQMFASDEEKAERIESRKRKREPSESVFNGRTFEEEYGNFVSKRKITPIAKRRKISKINIHSSKPVDKKPKTSTTKSPVSRRTPSNIQIEKNAVNNSSQIVVQTAKKSNYVIEDLELILQGTVKQEVNEDNAVENKNHEILETVNAENTNTSLSRHAKRNNNSFANVQNLSDVKIPLKWGLKSQVDLASELSDTDSSSKFSGQSSCGNKRILFKDVPRIPVCQVCLKNYDIVKKCKGACCGFYHPECIQLKEEPKEDPTDQVTIKENTKPLAMESEKIVDYCADETSSECSNLDNPLGDHFLRRLLEDFICINCKLKVDPPCFACNSTLFLEKHVKRFKCSVTGCGKYYHKECLKCWPQAIIDHMQVEDSERFVFKCPMHNCHVCTSDNPKACTSTLPIIRTARCLKCPATYHINSFCIPAGTEILSHTQVICPRHVDHRGKRYTINANWCFICSRGGNLLCCETCPTSVHQECISINLRPDDTFVCEECESGRLPLYDEIVWAKFAHYKWWPAVILYPEDIPDNVKTFPHRPGEFVVRFYGTHDHHWFGLGRVFLFQEDDKGESTHAPRRDYSFIRAVAEAKTALVCKKELKKQRDMAIRKSEKPPPFTKIRVNRLIGNLKPFDGDVSNTNACNCNESMENPCGHESDCLNRLLMTECDPEVCPAKEKCENQRFDKRQYPPLVPYKTESRGWGLLCTEALTKGQFIIEYVGDVIDQDEYQRRITKMGEQKAENYYFLTIDANRIIDAGPRGNVARFMNHCCAPNCETQKWTIKGHTRIGLFALRDIPANTELTFNYNLETVDNQRKVCHCGANNCSGFLGVKNKESNRKVKGGSKNKGGKNKKVQKEMNTSKVVEVEPEAPCFICNQLETDIDCTAKSCNKTYHLKCLEIQSKPQEKWTCPRHFCNICTKRTTKYCIKCLESYCPLHSYGVIKFNKQFGYVCNKHNPEVNTSLDEANTSNSNSIETENISETATTKQEITS